MQPATKLLEDDDIPTLADEQRSARMQREVLVVKTRPAGWTGGHEPLAVPSLSESLPANSATATPAPVAIEPAPRPANEPAPRSSAPAQVTSAAALRAPGFVDERNDILGVINELEDQLESQQRARQALETELRTANTRLNDILQETERLRRDSQSRQREAVQFGEVTQERDTLRADVTSLTARVEELEAACSALHEDLEHTRAALQDAQITVEELSSERGTNRAAQLESERQIATLTAGRDALNGRVEALRTERNALQARLQQLQRENLRLADERRQFEHEASALRESKLAAETSLAEVSQAFAEVRAALFETRARGTRPSAKTEA